MRTMIMKPRSELRGDDRPTVSTNDDLSIQPSNYNRQEKRRK